MQADHPKVFVWSNICVKMAYLQRHFYIMLKPLMGGIWDGDGLLQVILRPS